MPVKRPSSQCARRARLALAAAVGGMAPASAGATTTLAVDLSSPIGPAGHVASGSLYGVTETVPTDVMALVAPLHPNMFTNPAADVQQPVGDAIVVAGRVAPIGARVTIRLADLFPSWPYAFTTMTDWSMARDPRRSNEESCYWRWSPAGSCAGGEPGNWRRRANQMLPRSPGVPAV